MAGYNIYRADITGGPYSKINTGLVTGTSYTNSNLANGTPYYYVITAVDTSDSESEISAEATGTPLDLEFALQFDGINDYVTFGQASGLGATTFTLETWFKKTGNGQTTSTGSFGVIAVPLLTKGMGEDDLTNLDMNYFLGIDTTGVLAADFEECNSTTGGCPAGGSAGLNHPVIGTTVIQNNIWYHAAATYDGRYWNLYLNGQLDGQADVGATRYPRWDSIQHAGLGTALQSSGLPGTTSGYGPGYFQGMIDEARIWNHARTQTEIQDNRFLEISSGIGLLGRWGLDESLGLVAYDYESGINGTLMYGPTWTAGGFPPPDNTPPVDPTNLMSSARPGAVLLEWTANTEPDLAGYNIYRSTASPVSLGTPINSTLMLSPSYIDYDVTEGIEYFYAVTAKDTSGNESGLSNEASAIPLPPPPPEALDLGSNQAYVALGDNADTAQFTLETWLRRDGSGAATTTGSGGIDLIPLITNGTAEAENAAADINYFFGIRGTDGVLCADFEEAQTGTSPGLNHPVCGDTPLQNNAWYHAAVTYNGTTWRIYLNGNLDGELAVGQPANAANTSQLAFGTSLTTGDATSGFFDGVLDEVRIWNYPRTQLEIASTINTRIDTPQAGLIGRWGLDEGTGNVANDTSGNAITGNITGSGYTWVPGSPFNATVNLPPDAPQLAAPANGASNVPVSVELSVVVTDPENNPLDVTFYGRPLQAAAGPDFSIVAIPDPQYYASTYPSIYNAQMQWVADNQATNNIVYVASLGDNVDVASNLTQWDNADAAYDILDAAGVPYGLTLGNHDGAPSGTGNYNTYFGEARFTGRPYYGGHYGTDNDNHFALFSASGLNFIVIFIEYDDGMTSIQPSGIPVGQWLAPNLQRPPRHRRQPQCAAGRHIHIVHHPGPNNLQCP